MKVRGPSKSFIVILNLPALSQSNGIQDLPACSDFFSLGPTSLRLSHRTELDARSAKFTHPLTPSPRGREEIACEQEF